MPSGQVTITTSPTLIVGTNNTHRIIHIHGSSGAFFIGGSDVTSSTGFKIDNGEKISFQLTPADTMYGITSSGTAACGFFVTNR